MVKRHEQTESIIRHPQIMAGSGHYLDVFPAQGSELERPTHGSIFTARLPEGVNGGQGSYVRLPTSKSLFKGYNLYFKRDNLVMADEEGARTMKSLRTGDSCRFIVADQLLETAHHISERNWARVMLLRPIHLNMISHIYYPKMASREQVHDGTDQAVMSPTDLSAIVDSLLTEGEVSGFRLKREVFHWDVLYLSMCAKKNRDWVSKWKSESE